MNRGRECLLAGAFLLVLPGCGYQSGSPTTSTSGSDNGYHWSSLYRQDVHTVAVPAFSTRDFSKGIELRLTSAVIHDIEAFTPYKVAERDRADTILEGEVVSVRTNNLSNSSTTATPQEQLLTVTVNFTWKDLRTGEIITQRRNFDQQATYYPTLGESNFAGSQDAIEKLALGIVHELERPW